MAKVSVGKKVPAFRASATGGSTISLADLKGQRVVLYFYPKDSTPGCTQEGHDFNDRLGQFKRLNALVLGVSRDSIESHEKFREKQGFKFDLLSDPDEKLCAVFDVIKMKNMYGKKVQGIERSTFLLDENGVLRQEWRKVKVANHADEVLHALKSL